MIAVKLERLLVQRLRWA